MAAVGDDNPRAAAPVGAKRQSISPPVPPSDCCIPPVDRGHQFYFRRGIGTQPVGNLRHKEAVRFDRLVGAAPDAVAFKFAPAAKGPVARRRRIFTTDEGRAALPQNGIGRGPARAFTAAAAIGQAQAVAVNPHVVEKHAARPAFNRPAVPERQGRFALHKGIRPGRAMTHGKIMVAVFGPAPQEQGLLAHRVKCVPPPAGFLRHGCEGQAILPRSPICRFHKSPPPNRQNVQTSPGAPTRFRRFPS